jgi:hypothetical protein
MKNMEFLKAILAEMKEEMMTKMDANKERLEAKLHADREEKKAERAAMHEKLIAKSDADLAEAKMDTNKEKMTARLDAMIEDNSEKCETTRNTHVPGRKEPNPEKMEANTVEVKSVVVHEEFRTEAAAVKSSGTMKKRNRVRHLAAGRDGEPRELNRGNCGLRRNLAAAWRKVSRRARVTWRKRKIVGYK